MPSASNSKKGFTLFELLLVVILIAALYGVFVSKLTSRTDRQQDRNVTVATIGDYLRSVPKEEGDVRLVCLNQCESCDVYADGKKVNEAPIALFKAVPTVYRKDTYGRFQATEFLPMRNAEGVLKNVCFAYTLFENGSTSSFIMEYKNSFYLFDAYLQPTKRFDTLTEAQSAYDRPDLLPEEKRAYDF